MRHSCCNHGVCAAQEGRVRTGERSTSMVGEGQSGCGSSRLDRFLSGTLSLEALE